MLLATSWDGFKIVSITWRAIFHVPAAVAGFALGVDDVAGNLCCTSLGSGGNGSVAPLAPVMEWGPTVDGRSDGVEAAPLTQVRAPV
jgi:hypothetical protein